MVPPKKLTDVEKLIRLWGHETYRVFYDRLIDQNDRNQLLNIVQAACRTNLRMELSKALEKRIPAGEKICDETMRELIFGNYMEPDADPRVYDEVEDLRKLEKIMKYYLNEYNAVSNAPMDLVLFRFAIEHISRSKNLEIFFNILYNNT